MISDDEIVQSVIEGRKQHFEILVNRYKKKLLNFINRMIFDYDEAQNITQDVFLKIYENLSNYKKESNFQAFAFTIAKNLTLNYIKRQKKVLFLSNLLDKSYQDKYFRYDETQEQDIENREREELLMSNLRKMKENQRIALILKIYLDFSYKQISEITGWSVPKIESLISRAKEFLKLNIFLQEKGNLNVKRVRH